MNREWSRRGLPELLAGASVVGYSERQLLERFAIGRDESAFAAIVARHGPMVVRVCRSVLTNPADIDDAFQATFLVLVRKAGSLRDGDQLSPWLHGVARRVALRARSEAALRTRRESPGIPVEPTTADPSLQTAETRELAALIHAELGRLSLAERSAILLCDLEGLSHQEAADQLGWPLGTVKSRVNRGRDRLRVRLLRRGVTLPAGVLASGWLTQSTASAFVSPGLAAATTRAAVAWVAGRALSTSLISASVLSLTQGVSRTMILTKLKAGAVALAVASSVVLVPSLVAYQREPAPTGPDQTAPIPDPGKPGREPVPVQADFDSNPGAAIRIQVAEAAIKSIADFDKAKTPVDDDTRFVWYQRLATAQFEAARTKEERIKVVQAFVQRHQEFAAKHIRQITAEIAAKRSIDMNGNAWENNWNAANEAAQPIKTAQIWLKAVELATTGEVDPPTRKSEQTESVGTGLSKDIQPQISWVRLPSQGNDVKANQAIRAKLEERVSMNFPNDTPMADVQRYIEQSTQDERRGLPNGIPIYVDPQGLRDADKTLASTIAINMEGIPLRTTLTLLLDQLDLTYVVEGGLLLILSKDQVERSVNSNSKQ